MIKYSSRRQFLKTSTAFLAFAVVDRTFNFEKDKLRLSFSTLGCPDWSFDKIVNFAVENNYSGIEIRGIQRQMDLTKCKEFNSTENIAATMKLMKDKGLRFVDLGSSAEMHHSDATERRNNLDEAKRFIDLAQQLNCPYIRVFPNKLPKEDRNATIDLIVKGLIEAGDHAKGTKVMVLMETHGDMWTVTKEPPAEVYALLKNYIHHTHIKDAKLVDGNPQYKLMGKGEVPIFEAIDVLYKGGYQGYYSFEWEKLWHPEIDEPEIALADYPKAMKQHFKEYK